ncbi:MAG: bile acid:sodium symporter family protein, partial [Bacteroidales bacterium]
MIVFNNIFEIPQNAKIGIFGFGEFGKKIYNTLLFLRKDVHIVSIGDDKLVGNTVDTIMILNIQDFARVIKMPGPVFIGIFLQFLIMPSLAMGLVFTFGFEPEIAAGIILIGSCPGGVASNLMAYLARGNVALSVTMTSCSTLLSPVMTPLLMKVLAGRLVPINFVEMMFSILNMIIVPILAGLLANTILYGKQRWVRHKGWLLIMS